MPDTWFDDHVGGEVHPRPAFEGELEASLRAAWSAQPNTEPVRRVPVGGGRSRRSRRLLVTGLGAAAALVAVVVAAAVARDDDSSQVPADPSAVTGAPVPTAPDTAAPPSTRATSESTASSAPGTIASTAPGTTAGSPASTTAAPTSTALTPTGVELPDEGGFQPACADRSGTSGQPAASRRQGSFGPLQARPALTITLPVSVAPSDPPQPSGSSRLQSPTVQPVAIPGGVLLPIHSSSYGSFPGTMLAAVNDDGSVRWVRCSADSVFVSSAATPATNGGAVFVAVGHSDATTYATDWQLLSLLDGTPVGTAADVLAQHNPGLGDVSGSSTWYAASDRWALFGPAEDVTLDSSRDRLLIVDLDSLEATAIPLPEPVDGTAVQYAQFGIAADGTPTWRSSESATATALQWRSGGWATDPSSITVRFSPSDADGRLVLGAVDGTGTVVWTDPDIHDVSHEGFQLAPSGDVTVVNGCFGDPDPSNFCPSEALAGVRSSDGAVLWRLDGQRSVAAVGDGYALVTDPSTSGGWTMIDTATGLDIPGQRWADRETFAQQCCGGVDFVHVSEQAGIVIAVNEQRVTVWYPDDYPVTGEAAVALP